MWINDDFYNELINVLNGFADNKVITYKTEEFLFNIVVIHKSCKDSSVNQSSSSNTDLIDG